MRFIGQGVRFLWRAAFVILLCLSLALNVASVAMESVASAMSSAFESVTGKPSAQTKKTAALKSSLDKKDRALIRASSQLSTASMAMIDASRKLTSTGNELKRSSQKISSLTSEVSTLKRNMAGPVKEAAKKVQERTARGAARSMQSLYGGAIPYAGVAVAVGVTGWEIKDACATISDMRSIASLADPSAPSDDDGVEVCGWEAPTLNQVWSAIKSSPSTAWHGAKGWVPDLPDLGDINVSVIDWTFWN